MSARSLTKHPSAGTQRDQLLDPLLILALHPLSDSSHVMSSYILYGSLGACWALIVAEKYLQDAAPSRTHCWKRMLWNVVYGA